MPGCGTILETDFFEYVEPVTGTASLTIESPTGAATGSHGVSGAATAYLGDVSWIVDENGDYVVDELGNRILDVTLQITVSATGEAGATDVTGTGNLTTGSPTVTATGTFPYMGTASLVIASPTMDSDGVHGVSGAGAAITVAQPTASASGVRGVTGTASATATQATVSASGEHTTPPVQGVGSLAVVGISVAAVGVVGVTGTGSCSIVSPYCGGASEDESKPVRQWPLGLAVHGGRKVPIPPRVGSGVAVMPMPTCEAYGQHIPVVGTGNVEAPLVTARAVGAVRVTGEGAAIIQLPQAKAAGVARIPLDEEVLMWLMAA